MGAATDRDVKIAELSDIRAEDCVTTAEFRQDPADILERVAVLGEALGIVAGDGAGPIIAVMVPVDDAAYSARSEPRRPLRRLVVTQVGDDRVGDGR